MDLVGPCLDYMYLHGYLCRYSICEYIHRYIIDSFSYLHYVVNLLT